MSSRIVIKNCHQKLSSKIVIKSWHQKFEIKRCLSESVNESVSEWVSDRVTYWAVWGQLKIIERPNLEYKIGNSEISYLGNRNEILYKRHWWSPAKKAKIAWRLDVGAFQADGMALAVCHICLICLIIFAWYLFGICLIFVWYLFDIYFLPGYLRRSSMEVSR